MSLYGALFGGVSGLQGQGSKIGIISDNIANVNTVGYKEAVAQFETLVINQSLDVSYQTGGVIAGTRISVDQQGLILSTDAPTDIAISGDGFFVVNEQIDGSGQPLYTRAGSFRADSDGNLVNAAGFFLRGWPLDLEGRLPGEPGNINTTSSENLDSLETVNVQDAGGAARATTEVELGVNLNAGADIFPGEAGTITMDQLSANNFEIDADDIIAPDEFYLSPNGSLAATNSIYRGDQFRVTTGAGLQFDYEYGGFTVGRDIADTTAANVGDAQNDIYALTVIDNAAVTLTTSTTTVQTINFPAHGLVSGNEITLAGFAATDGIPAAELNTTHTITVVDANNFTITTTTAGGAGGVNGAGTETIDIRQYVGSIFDATTASQNFFGTTGTSDFTTAALNFTITTASLGTSTFTFTNTSANPLAGQFNSLNTLATAIDEVNGLTARIVNGRLLVGSEDATEAVTFANGDATGTPASARGIDWISELDFQDVTAGSRRFSNLQGLANIVNGDDGVTAVVENPLTETTIDIRVDDPLDTIQFTDVGINAIDLSTLAGAITVPATATATDIDVTIDFGAVDPTATFGIDVGDDIIIQNEAAGLGGLPGLLPNNPPNVAWAVTAIAANVVTFRIPAALNVNPAGVAGGAAAAGAATGTLSILGESNQGSLLAEFGLVNSLNSVTPYTAQDTGALGPQYDSGGVIGSNLASGDLTTEFPDEDGIFSHTVRIFDALGAGHDIRYSYMKIDENEWAVEVYAIPESDVNTSLVDGQIAVGTLAFNGDGTLRSVSAGLADPITVFWTNGAEPSELTFDWGTAGQPFGTIGATVFGDDDGMRQFDDDYNVGFTNQDGAPVGELVSVTIDDDGFVIASFDNGDSQRLYQLPLADFINPNGLQALSGNVFAETADSGNVALREAKTNGVGEVVPASLEQSNVDLSEQLTEMIVAQRAFQANTRVVSTTDELLEQLTQI